MSSIRKTIIAIVAIIIILLIVLLLLLKSNGSGNAKDILEDGEEIIPEQDANGYVELEDENIFFSVVSSVEKYIYAEKYDENFSIEEVDESNANSEMIYKLLDDNYIKNNNISLNNLQNYIYEIDESTKFIPMQMKVKYGQNVNTYILKAYLVKDTIQEKYFVVRVDNINGAFSLEFTKENPTSIENLKVTDNDKNIQRNDYNIFEIQMMSKEAIAQKYLEHYRELVLANPEEVYNKFLNNEYKEKRFGSLEEYKKYISNDLEEIQNIYLTRYSIETKENNIVECVCVDQYKNIYIFDASSTLQYTIKFDTYTLSSDDYKEEYAELSDRDKVISNVNRFVMMLNNRDYKTIYKNLNTDFISQNFDTEEKFEQVMREKFPSHYDMELGDYSKRGENSFVQRIVLIDVMDDNEEKIEINIVIQLEEDNSFSMLFS